jgi:hypothetical protein
MATAEGENVVTRPIIVCLCGSNRYWRDYIEQNILFTKSGCIVISVGGFITKDEACPPFMRVEVSHADKQKLDRLHLAKIDMADEILFLNRDGYMGDSTLAELDYARKCGKHIRFLEPPKPEHRQARP